MTNTTNLIKLENNLIMTTREIANLTSKEHKNVIADTRNMFESLEIDSAVFSAQYKDSTGRTLPMFTLNKELTMTLVAGYNVKMRHAIIKRWQELEAKEQKNQIILPNFTDPAEAAMAWALQYKEKQIALQQLEIAKPKAEFVDKYVERDVAKNLTNVAKELGVSAKALGAWLRKEGHAFKSADKLVWTQPFVDKGYGVHKHFSTDSKAGSQALITPSGDCFIKKNFN